MSTIQPLLSQVGDVIARMSQVTETMQRDVAKWEELSSQLDEAFDRVQRATAQIDDLEKEVATLEEKRTTLENTIAELKSRI